MRWISGVTGVWYLASGYGYGYGVLTSGEWIIRCRRRRHRM